MNTEKSLYPTYAQERIHYLQSHIVPLEISLAGFPEAEKEAPIDLYGYVTAVYKEMCIRDRTNSIYLRARYYNPGIGRFTQQDPAMADGYNWYVYCSGNPIKFKDPTGCFNSGSTVSYTHLDVYKRQLLFLVILKFIWWKGR